MADARRLSPVVADYAVFVALLALRCALDIARFPVDGYSRITPVNLIEAQVFYIALHYGVYLTLRANRLPVAAASRVALLVMAVYLFLHLLEYWFPAGGRAAVYAPAGHLRDNLFSAFLATGDAGFWQVMRIFVCGMLLLLVLISRRAGWRRMALTLPLLYLWGMLLAHPQAWLFLPAAADEPALVAELGVRSFIISAWFLLGVALATRIEHRGRGLTGVASLAFPAAWVAGLCLVLFWQPMLTGGTSAVAFLLLQCGGIAHLAANTPTAAPAANGPDMGDVLRWVLLALVGAIMAALWPQIGLLGLGLVAWLVLERRVLGRARPSGAAGFGLGAGLGVLWLLLSALQPVLLSTVVEPQPRLSGAVAGQAPVLVLSGVTPCRLPPMS